MALFTIDFETYWDQQYTLSKLTPEQYIHDGRFQVIGFSLKVNDAPARWFSGTDAELEATFRQLKPLMETGAVLMHNAIFDGAILAFHYGIIPRLYLDSMFMARPWVTPHTGRASLASVAEHLKLPAKGTQVHQYRGYRRENFSPAELADYGSYCCHDTELCHTIFQRLKHRFPPDEFKVMDRVVRLYTQPAFQLDPHVLATHLQAVRNRKEQLIQQAGLEDRDRLMSNPQFAELLKSLGVDPPTKVSARTGLETWAFAKSDLDFKALLDHPDEPVQAAVAARIGVKSTLEETRTERFLAHAHTHRPFPIPLLYYGAHTGRFSGLLKLNCQNLPRGGALRRSMTAPPGHVVLAVDSRQIEARLNAWCANQHDLLTEFRNKVDVYASFASRGIYHYPVTEATHPEERRVGKIGILSLGYGAGVDKFEWMAKSQGVTGMTNEQSNVVVRAYRQLYSRIRDQWYQGQTAISALVPQSNRVYELGPCVAMEGQLLLPNGMALSYPDVHSKDAGWAYRYGKERRHIYGAKLIENMIQALAFAIIKWQLVQIPPHWRFAMQAHDELVFVVKEAEADEALRHIVDVMSTPPPWGAGLPLDAAGGYGPNYVEAK